MEVRDGWSTQYGSQKYDVTVQEQDLHLIFSEYGIPAEYIEKLTVSEKWAIMTRYAHMFAVTESIRLVTADQITEATIKAQYEAANCGNALHAFMARVGLVKAEEPARPYPTAQESDDSAAGIPAAVTSG
jgi:hypothetical protein